MNEYSRTATIITTAIYDDQTTKLKRYSLLKEWDGDKNKSKKKATIIMYNPSIASELKTDLTICKSFNIVIDEKFSKFEVVNLFAKRAKNPNEVKAKDKKYDPINFKYIRDAFETADIIIVAWGGEGGKKKRDRKILDLMSSPEIRPKLRCLYTTRDNNMEIGSEFSSTKPVHPRNISEDTAKIVKFDFEFYISR